jgi:hypothetical protein
VLPRHPLARHRVEDLLHGSTSFLWRQHFVVHVGHGVLGDDERQAAALRSFDRQADQVLLDRHLVVLGRPEADEHGVVLADGENGDEAVKLLVLSGLEDVSLFAKRGDALGREKAVVEVLHDRVNPGVDRERHAKEPLRGVSESAGENAHRKRKRPGDELRGVLRVTQESHGFTLVGES